MQSILCMYSNPWETSDSWGPCEIMWTVYVEDRLTNFDLGASGKRTRYSLRLPYSIHAEMVENGEADVSTPRRGNIFGWFKFFQMMTSL